MIIHLFSLQSPYYDMPAFQAAGREGLSTTFHGKHTWPAIKSRVLLLLHGCLNKFLKVSHSDL